MMFKDLKKYFENFTVTANTLYEDGRINSINDEESILALIKTNPPKGYTVLNVPPRSWYDFASEIVILAKVDCKINAIETKDYPILAKRPSYSVLSKEKVKKDFNIKISDWKECIKNCLDQF